MAKKKVNSFSKETTTYIDVQTGEFISTEIITKKHVSADMFLQVYLDDFGPLMGIEGDAQFKIILWIGKNMHYETNEVFLVKEIKKRISVDIDYSYKTVENSISALSKIGILIRTGGSIYMLNPKLFFKGKIQDRQSLIRTMEYHIISNDITGEVDMVEE